MSHEAVGWALHALEPDEESEFLAHLPECERCTLSVRETEKALALFGTGVEQVDPPASFHSGLMELVARTPQVSQPVPAATGGRPHRLAAEDAAGPRRRRWSLTPRGRKIVAAKLAVAAALTIGVLGVQIAQISTERDLQAAQAAGLTELVERLAAPGTEHALLATPEGSTVAAVVVNGGTPQIYSVGLAANDTSAQTYVLWGIGGDGVPAPLGAFDVNPSSGGGIPVGSPTQAGNFGLYAISIEAGRVAPASPSVVVASGQVAL